jgi:hypothetical protein
MAERAMLRELAMPSHVEVAGKCRSLLAWCAEQARFAHVANALDGAA